MTYARNRETKKKRTDRKNTVGFSFENNLLEMPYKHSKIQTKKLIKPRTLNQSMFVESLKNNKITFGIGAAGCGKSLLAIHTGIVELNSEASPIEKIIYVRANVGCDDENDIGALPGELQDKVTPLAYPVYDNCREFMEDSAVKCLFEFEKIEVLPVAYLRGRSFANCFVIVDEAQNLTKTGMKTILTRMSHGSRLVLIGDPEQCDLREDRDMLWRVGVALSDIDSIGFIPFGKEDILRDNLIHPILEKLKQVQ